MTINGKIKYSAELNSALHLMKKPWNKPSCYNWATDMSTWSTTDQRASCKLTNLNNDKNSLNCSQC